MDRLVQAAIDLLPVIAGGLLAILGTVLGPILTHSFSSRQASVEHRREKLEQMLELVIETTHWLEGLRLHYMFGEGDDKAQSPLERALAIGGLYFPELNEKFDALEVAANSYIQWCLERAQERLARGGAPAGLLPPDMLAEYRGRYAAVRKSVQQLRHAAGDVMKSLSA